MIFILLRKIAAPVALIVAWLGVTSFAFVKFNENEKVKLEYQETLALKVNEEIKAAEENEVEDEELAVQTEAEDVIESDNIVNLDEASRGNATSRSGSRNERDVNVVCEGVDTYSFKLSKKEVELIKKIRKNESIRNKLYKEFNID